MTEEKGFFIIDGSGYIYRAFYALGRLTDSRGMPTQAIYGFAQMLLKVIRERDPSHVCVVFDPPGPSFRSGLYADYKATRQRMPEDLVVQIPFIKTFTQLCGIPQLEMEGYEADDVIATLTRSARGQDCRVVVVSGDKDLHQLIEDPDVVQWDPQRDRWMAEKDVLDRFGVTSRQFRDFLALMGDSSD
ncbi:MAG: DNA polymerase I, partial [Syntrophobacteraceae bacterium]|nr:DNA polymerase I [Syntrophobacteraceae bacterium]